MEWQDEKAFSKGYIVVISILWTIPEKQDLFQDQGPSPSLVERAEVPKPTSLVPFDGSNTRLPLAAIRISRFASKIGYRRFSFLSQGTRGQLLVPSQPKKCFHLVITPFK